MFDGLRPSDEALPGTGGARRPQREAPARKGLEDPEAVLRKARTKALIRHARAVNAIFDMQDQGGEASPEQVKELQEARKVFEEVRPYGSHDAEAAYKKNPKLALEAASGNSARAVRALQLATELRTDPGRCADRFVERWQKLDHTSQRQYQAGDIAGSREAAAAYICVSPNTFDQMVKNRQMPRARLLGERRRAWDVRQLDIAIDELPSDGDNTRVDETWSDVDAPQAAASR